MDGYSSGKSDYIAHREEFARLGLSWDRYEEWERERYGYNATVTPGPSGAPEGYDDPRGAAGFGGTAPGASGGAPGYGAGGYGAAGGYGTPGGAPGYGAGAGYDAAGAGYSGPRLSKKELLALPELKKIKSNITASAVISYICAGITVLVAAANNNYASLIDVAVLIILGLGIQIKYSKGCALALLIYSIINVIAVIYLTHRLGGYLVVIAGIYAFKATSAFSKIWAEYQRSGLVYPDMK